MLCSAYEFISYCRFPSLQTKVNLSAALTMEPTTVGSKKNIDVGLCDAIALAKKALEASKEAASLVEDSKLVLADSDDVGSVRLVLCFWLGLILFSPPLLCFGGMFLENEA